MTKDDEYDDGGGGGGEDDDNGKCSYLSQSLVR